MCIRHGFIRDVAILNVDPAEQRGITLARFAKAEVRELLNVS